MTSQHDVHSQPPRMAVWLLVLFAPAEQTESMLGDLLEEFSSLVRTSGLGLARRWYWRQTLNSIQHACVGALRAAPLLMVVAVVAGVWSIGFATTLSQHATRTFLDAHGIYQSHPDAYLFWSKFPLRLGRLLICALVGCVAALVAKRREMQVATVLSLAQMAMFFVAAIAVIARGEEWWFQWFVVMFKWNSLCAIATIVGGLIVKVGRISTRNGHSPA
jgi:hypothetical protein